MEITGLSPVSVLAAFAFGALSFLSPCVLPLLPGYLTMMSGYSAADLAENRASTARMLRVTLLFVGGFTVVFVLLGAAATTVGRALLHHQDSLAVIGGWVVVAMGLFLAATAIWTPRFLLPLLRERRVEVRPSRLGAWAPPVMGVAFGFAWTPCIGPTLGSILALTAVGRQGTTVAAGMVLLAVFSLGLGLPFVLAGLGMGRAINLLGRVRRYSRPITVVSGLLLAGFGVLMVTGELTTLNRWFQQNLPAWLWDF
jgi:cytochrome c-type biogenesis protein